MDIDVRKKSPGLIPFILGAVVLGLVIWGLIRVFDRDEQLRIDTPAMPADTVFSTTGAVSSEG